MDRLPLDPLGEHALGPAGVFGTTAPRSPLAGALRRHLRMEGDRAWLGDVLLGRWAGSWEPGTRLTPLELRFLADRGVPHPAADLPELPRPRTDLHTHFAGCVRGDDLVGIGVAHGVVVPVALLRRAGIEASGDRALGDLPEAARRAYARALALPVDVQSTHHDMNRVYDLRRPITKHRPAFPDLCAQIARDYAAMGVIYAELSLFEILDAEVLALATEALPGIRAETGVDLRFLAALSRHDDLEWDLDMLGRLEAYAGSSVIVGVDVMGHETSSTRAIVPHLQAIGAFVRDVRPDFAIRVHAGENPAFPENVRVAVDTLAEAGVSCRIGHGVYGVDEPTLARLVETGAIVEFNLDSNYALNNVRDALEVPLARYAAAGVPVVLGTDGYGIYHGDAAHQARGAALAGLSDGGALIRAEDAVLAARAAADARLDGAFRVPARTPGALHYTAEVASRITALQAADRELLEAAVHARGAELLALDALDVRFPGARWISVAGSWRGHWAGLDLEDRARISAAVEEFVGALPAGGVLLTGGTVYGVEGVVHGAASRAGVPVVGCVVDASPADALDRLAVFARVGRTLWEKAGGLYGFLGERAGSAVFFGGGQIVGDEVRTAINLRLRRAWLAGVPGASGSAAERWPAWAFRTGAEALARLDGVRPRPVRAPGPNPCADLVVVRGGREVLLIRRAAHADAEPGRWALPGGFLRPGEDPRAGALRELAEEAGLDVRWLADQLVPVGVYEGGGRDPRDTPERWVRSHVFRLALPPALAARTLVGGDDASDARWWPLDGLPHLAFDHARILGDALG